MYIGNLASELSEQGLNLDYLELMPDQEVRTRLVKLKGICNWTADIYLMLVLQRADIFPIGDLAAVNSLKEQKDYQRKSPVRTCWK